MTVGGPDAFIPEALAADTRIPLMSDWSPNWCADAPMKSAVRWVISDVTAEYYRHTLQATGHRTG